VPPGRWIKSLLIKNFSKITCDWSVSALAILKPKKKTDYAGAVSTHSEKCPSNTEEDTEYIYIVFFGLRMVPGVGYGRIRRLLAVCSVSAFCYS
jgi:hypothetical protein